MRLTDEQLTKLKTILGGMGLDYCDEEAQDAGLAIMRFAIAKARRDPKIMKDMERIWMNIEKS